MSWPWNGGSGRLRCVRVWGCGVWGCEVWGCDVWGCKGVRVRVWVWECEGKGSRVMWVYISVEQCSGLMCCSLLHSSARICGAADQHTQIEKWERVRSSFYISAHCSFWLWLDKKNIIYNLLYKKAFEFSTTELTLIVNLVKKKLALCAVMNDLIWKWLRFSRNYFFFTHLLIQFLSFVITFN